MNLVLSGLPYIFTLFAGFIWQNCVVSAAGHNNGHHQNRQSFKRNRIIGGDDVTNLPPFMVSIRYYGAHLCGASILDERVIMTAGHCLMSEPKDIKELTVVAGQLNLDIQTPATYIANITHALRHSKYVFKGGRNYFDVVLLRVHPPFPLRHGQLQKVKLPSASIFQFDRRKLTCLVFGWGHTEQSDKYAPSRHLKMGQVYVVTMDECRHKFYMKDEEAPSILCAGGAQLPNGMQVDACQFDSGGPLVCSPTDSNDWTQYGIVSWGDGCGKAGSYGVYTNVKGVKDFVDEVRPWLHFN